MKERIEMAINRLENCSNDELDQLLNSPNQIAIQKTVKGLSDEPTNLAWRSTLNEKLFRDSKKASRYILKRRWLVMSPVAGIAVVAGFAFFLISKPKTVVKSPATISQVSSEALAKALVAEHSRSDIEQDVLGPSPSPLESRSDAIDSSDPDSALSDL